MRYSFALLALAAGSVFAAGNTAPLPWFFIEDSATRFVIEAPRMRAVFTSDGAAFQAGEDLIRVRFGGADGDVAGGVELRGAQPEGHANFLVGQDTSAWRTGLPTYRQIVYRHLYPGIDLAYSAGAGQFKSEFRVAPGPTHGGFASNTPPISRSTTRAACTPGFSRSARPRSIRNRRRAV